MAGMKKNPKFNPSSPAVGKKPMSPTKPMKKGSKKKMK
jgi:hypothetical protein